MDLPRSRLPNELIAHCLPPGDDIVHLWSLRDVSSAFRAEIDHYFRTNLLPDTVIRVDWPSSSDEPLTDGLQTWECSFLLRAEFVGFADEEKEIAVFRDTETHWFPAYADIMKAKWAQALAEYESTHREGSPSDALVPWTISIKAAVNDTELPGYRGDYEKREISFRWQDAYQCFFREVVCINKTILKKEESFRRDLHSVPRRVPAGEIEPWYNFDRAWKENEKRLGKTRQKARRNVRRRRIAKQMSAHGSNPSIQSCRCGFRRKSKHQGDFDNQYADDTDSEDSADEDFSEKNKLQRMLDLEIALQNEAHEVEDDILPQDRVIEIKSLSNFQWMRELIRS